MAELFAFVTELADDRDALAAQSREVLRSLGRGDDRVALYLPFSPPTPAVNVHPSLPEALQTLKKTALLEIHSPSARNALSGKMMAELADVVALLEDAEVHGKLNAVVVRGTGGWFCAGADLRVAQQELTSPEAGAAMGALMIDTLTRFRRLPLVSVACIEGGAYGGGAELATACDFRILETRAVIQFVQVRMGVSPAWGGGAILYKIVGRQDALRLLCTAEKLTADRALELKLADFTFDAATDGADAAICSFVTPFDAIAPAVSHGAKRVINRADDVSLDAVLSYEHDVFKSLWGGPANLEALEGALNKKNK
ncbi:enoyl CoA hydratase domain-containing protein 1 [Phytophthora pseudosyringae]|uniref:Ethylmalonyl-CoA decarboxylase n=1 Tax=Phytophthora pseudosyringae TaxID=221518 RepID=A0A8T1WHF3_9STRA|nr:enoyl CoA hydratase domain-containing protein 1 [Phytophthora pseudosyringae]